MLIVAPFGAAAHPLDLGVLNLTLRGTSAHVRLELNPEIAAQILAQRDLNAQHLAEQKERLFALTLQAAELRVDAKPCAWTPSVVATFVNTQLLFIEVDAYCPVEHGDVDLELPFLARLSASYRLLAVARWNEAEHVGGADPEHRRLHFSFAQPEYAMSHFIEMGLQHIGVAPSEWQTDGQWHLPKGLDHILFVIALLISGGSLWNFLKTVTGFTLGHTTSLALVTFGFVQVGGRWVEAAIALTIAGVAAHGLLSSRGENTRLTFAIGLVHGLGFAAALRGLGLQTFALVNAVIGFNLGVEVGQAAIVLILAPALYYFSQAPAYRRWVRPAICLAIIILGVKWFIERI